MSLAPLGPARLSVHPASAGLRELADFMDQCWADSVEFNGHGIEVSFYSLGLWNEVEAKTIKGIARHLRSFDKDHTDTLFKLRKVFGDCVTAQFVSYREAVCERVVVGTEEIPATILPAVPAQAERVVPARTVEKVEWRCGKSLLDNGIESAEAAS